MIREVSKFGGGVGTNYAQIRSYLECSKGKEQTLIVSAPALDRTQEGWVTEILEATYRGEMDGIPRVRQIMRQVAGRHFDKGYFDSDLARARREGTRDSLVALGELAQGRALAAYLGAHYIDPRNVVNVRDGKIQNIDSGRIGIHPLEVMGGFVGADHSQPDNPTAVLDRGGSDISAAEVTVAIGAARCNYLKDERGIHVADPRIVPGASVLRKASWDEAYELGIVGARVLHWGATQACRDADIPAVLRSLKHLDDPGTEIVNHYDPSLEQHPILGLVLQPGFTTYTFACSRRQLGSRVKTLLTFLGERDISFDMIGTTSAGIYLTTRAEQDVPLARYESELGSAWVKSERRSLLSIIGHIVNGDFTRKLDEELLVDSVPYGALLDHRGDVYDVRMIGMNERTGFGQAVADALTVEGKDLITAATSTIGSMAFGTTQQPLPVRRHILSALQESCPNAQIRLTANGLRWSGQMRTLSTLTYSVPESEGNDLVRRAHDFIYGQRRE